MSTFVLVHGSWHGAWCWYKIVALLERAGHRAIAVDLPSLGVDKTPIADVTLQTWTDSVVRVLDAEAEPEPVVLVGHSRGGIVISQAAEARPEKVGVLVYLAAFLPRDGDVLFQIAESDVGSPIIPNLIFADDRRSAMISLAAVKDVFYGQCADEDVALARLLLGPEPLAPLNMPVRLTEQRFGRTPRVYIECLRDQAITPAAQRRMYEATPCAAVLSIDTDHSPFFSAPTELVEHITSSLRFISQASAAR